MNNQARLPLPLLSVVTSSLTMNHYAVESESFHVIIWHVGHPSTSVTPPSEDITRRHVDQIHAMCSIWFRQANLVSDWEPTHRPWECVFTMIWTYIYWWNHKNIHHTRQTVLLTHFCSGGRLWFTTLPFPSWLNKRCHEICILWDQSIEPESA